MSPTRKELETAVAKQYGFEGYGAFRTFFAAEFGKGFLNKLEAELTKKEKQTEPH
jgi:DNA-binding MurR/RpiR family transcriptional regulator